MNKEINGSSTDTVSSVKDNGRVIPQPGSHDLFLDYTYLCKKIFSESKAKMDACFLAPLKAYKENKEIRREENFTLLKKWVDAFSEKHEVRHFWVFLAYCGGFKLLKGQGDEICLSETDVSNAIQDVRSYMADVSKLEKNQYMVRLCKNRKETEYWILNIYELMLSKLYSMSTVTELVERVIAYLKDNGIKIDLPKPIGGGQEEKQVFQNASNLMLFVMRLRLKIDYDSALSWYQKGNAAYFRYRDHMLEEYIRLAVQFTNQSYERFMKMKDIAKENKYAAKEVGDIYRLGMELLDGHGNRIYIKANEEIACEFYLTCVDHEYVPAYISAIKTNALINAVQREEFLKKALEEGDAESLAYYAAKCMEDAEQGGQTKGDYGLLKKAVSAIARIEDSYGEKQVLKGRLLDTKIFETYKNDASAKDAELDRVLIGLYSQNVLKTDKGAILEEMEKIYLAAQKQGYFEAEYQLGKLFQGSDGTKSRKYFEEGKQKGCKRCMMEYARAQKGHNPQEWLRTMTELGQHMYKDHALQMLLAKEWAESAEVFGQIMGGQVRLEMDEIMAIYFQINYLAKKIFNMEESCDNKIRTKLNLVNTLYGVSDQLRRLALQDKNL